MSKNAYYQCGCGQWVDSDEGCVDCDAVSEVEDIDPGELCACGSGGVNCPCEQQRWCPLCEDLIPAGQAGEWFERHLAQCEQYMQVAS